MSSSSPSQNTASSTDKANEMTVVAGGDGPEESVVVSNNEGTLICSMCSSVVLLPSMGRWHGEKTFELPLARQQKGVDTQKESVSGYWAVRDMFHFENVGFTHSVNGVKYLTCADCEYGPIGLVDEETKWNFVAPSRLTMKL